MNQELLDKIKKRKQLIDPDAPAEPEGKKETREVHRGGEAFKEKQRELERNLFKKEAPQEEVKKEEPKGNTQNFNQAKLLLEQQFAAKVRATSPSVVLRNDPLVEMMALAQGRTAAELDAFFTTYSAV